MATGEQIEELRLAIKSRIADGGAEPHPADAQRLQDDGWLARFVLQLDGDVKLAADMLESTLAWRKASGANDIGPSNMNMDYINDGLFFPRGVDVDGCTLFIFKCKRHVKGQRDLEDIKKCVVYWLDRLEKVHKCRRISVFFDFADTGLSNMDMELTKYLISMFKYYYPDFLNYIFIFELPWVLNAAFKVIKTLLPAKAVEKMKFISKSTFSEFIPAERALRCWGGEDDYVYAFEESGQPENPLKKVTFSDPGIRTPPKGGGDSMISISPKNVAFSQSKNDANAILSITNTHTGFIIYKVKTTSPEKFRVRPSTGILSAGDTKQIQLTLLHPYKIDTNSGKEKFLVMCLPAPSDWMSAEEILGVWKAPAAEPEQHKLRCWYATPAHRGSEDDNGSAEMCKEKSKLGSSSPVDSEVSKTYVDKKFKFLEVQLHSLKSLLLFSVMLNLMLLCGVVYFFMRSEDHSAEFCRP